MKEQLDALQAEALAKISGCTSLQELQDVRVAYLGKKGAVTALLKGLGKLDKEERPKMGAMVNTVREALEAELSNVQAGLEAKALRARLDSERIDITLHKKLVISIH